MSIPVDKLVMAIYAEHRQRTGHDVTTEPKLGTLKITCEVCLWLDVLMRELEKMMYEDPEEEADEDQA